MIFLIVSKIVKNYNSFFSSRNSLSCKGFFEDWRDPETIKAFKWETKLPNLRIHQTNLFISCFLVNSTLYWLSTRLERNLLILWGGSKETGNSQTHKREGFTSKFQKKVLEYQDSASEGPQFTNIEWKNLVIIYFYLSSVNYLCMLG